MSTLPLTPAQINYAEPEQWKQVIKQALTNVRVATPAFLTEDMSADQTVTVQIAIQERVRTLTGPQWWDVPPIIKVPVVLPRGGGFSITLPLKKYDEGLLVFCDTCFDYWWTYGRQNAPVAQNLSTNGLPASGSQQQLEVRRHHVHDCGFIPGMGSQPNLLTAYATTSMQLRSDDGATIVDVAAGTITITGPTAVNLVSPHVNANATGGTPEALVNDTWFQWWTTNIFPFLQGLGYLGPPVPVASETTVLKGQ